MGEPTQTKCPEQAGISTSRKRTRGWSAHGKQEFIVMNPETDLGMRLRRVRKQKGMTLAQVESASRGRWKSVVIGSYERGDRSITAANLARLAAFYSVPIEEFFPQPTSIHPKPISIRPLIDLPKLKSDENQNFDQLRRFVYGIERSRDDWNGQILSIRKSDLTTMSILNQSTVKQFLALALQSKVIVATESEPD